MGDDSGYTPPWHVRAALCADAKPCIDAVHSASESPRVLHEGGDALLPNPSITPTCSGMRPGPSNNRCGSMDEGMRGCRVGYPFQVERRVDNAMNQWIADRYSIKDLAAEEEMDVLAEIKHPKYLWVGFDWRPTPAAAAASTPVEVDLIAFCLDWAGACPEPSGLVYWGNRESHGEAVTITRGGRMGHQQTLRLQLYKAGVAGLHQVPSALHMGRVGCRIVERHNVGQEEKRNVRMGWSTLGGGGGGPREGRGYRRKMQYSNGTAAAVQSYCAL